MGQELKKLIDQMWELDEGFLGKLRHGIFDEKKYQEAREILRNWPTDTNYYIQKEIVSGLWFIPVFMERQKKVVGETYPEADYFRCQEEIIDAIADILGYP